MAKCSTCKRIKQYFEKELNIIQTRRPELEKAVGEDVYNGMLATVQAYHHLVTKETARCK